MDTKTICNKFLGELGDIQNMSLNGDKECMFSKCEHFSSFYGNWIQQIRTLSIEQIGMFELSLREYELSLMFAVSGLYKQAMESVRFSLEHALFSIMLSTNELHFRLWKSSSKDETWAEIVNPETGVYGDRFISAFAPELIDHGATLQTLARNVYRECSEYVHGNYSVMQEIPLRIEYNEVLYNKFFEKADSVAYLISFALTIRYWDKLDGSMLSVLEGAIMSYLSTIPEILALYEA